MKDWIPLITELIWPTLIGFLIWWNKKWFVEFLDIIKKRVEEGGEIQLGPAGFSVGNAPLLPASVNPDDMIDDGSELENSQDTIPDEPSSNAIADKILLSHRTAFWKIKNGRAYYKIFITTHADNQETKSKIQKVVYHLHPTFKNPRRVISSEENDFLLKTNGWGEFVVRAEVYLEDIDEPVKLNRYIDLNP
ncbi:pYEATS domain-containing protein [Gimesia aquarii]|uniref:YEATS family protein n=1 Tax=Gimesia aquarii TaxID=2527964 RepID=A0A517VYF4_9PLAN|nr:pYEATS domain-containing protein [Gimesia aquarii]QDT98021.1 YEATS family protein [Gimesia aquarii]